MCLYQRCGAGIFRWSLSRNFQTAPQRRFIPTTKLSWENHETFTQFLSFIGGQHSKMVDLFTSPSQILF